MQQQTRQHMQRSRGVSQEALPALSKQIQIRASIVLASRYIIGIYIEIVARSVSQSSVWNNVVVVRRSERNRMCESKW